jgi:hypothetical protein
MKTGVISGTEDRKHENMKTGVMAPVFMFLVLCSTDDTSFYVLGILLHRWHQFSCFRCSAPLMTPSVEQSTENIKTGVISGAEYQKHEN